jgi:hypothetical protein
VWSTSSVQAVLGGQDATRLRWVTAHEVPGAGVVHALDMLTNTPAHPIESEWTPQPGTTWRELVSDGRCERCEQLLRAVAGE